MSTDQSFVGSYTPTSLYNIELERNARLERDLATAQTHLRRIVEAWDAPDYGGLDAFNKLDAAMKAAKEEIK